MERIEAQARVQAAVNVLRSHGWAPRQCERLLDGLYRDDAVEVAERTVESLSFHEDNQAADQDEADFLNSLPPIDE